MRVTLGGDRLGAGKKMKVELHGFERSTHDLSYLFRTTMSAGTLVPFLSEVGLPDDTFDIDLNADVKTHPTVGPLFGSYQLGLDLFVAPIRLYQARLTFDELSVGLNMTGVYLPALEMTATDTSSYNEYDIDLDNAQINPSSIMAYLGLRGVGRSNNNDMRYFNAIPLLMYWDIYKNYYANKQEKEGVVIHTPAEANVTTVTDIKVDGTTLPQSPSTGRLSLRSLTTVAITYTVNSPKFIMLNIEGIGIIPIEDALANIDDDGVGTIRGTWNVFKYGEQVAINWRYRTAVDMWPIPKVKRFALSDLDLMRRKILQHVGNNAFLVTTTSPEPYKWVPQLVNGIPNLLSSQEGLGVKTYKSDLFNNWLETESIDGAGGINDITAVDTSGNSFQIPSLILARKLYDMLNRVQATGGSYEDWIAANWSENKYKRCTTPMYMGGLRQEIVFQEVVSNSGTQTEQSGQPLGTLAGRGVLHHHRRGGSVRIKIEEPSWVMGIVHITPRIDYSQGNNWNLHLETLDDFHKPAMDEIGFQDLITEQMAWWDTKFVIPDGWVQKSAGKQPAYTNYMTNVNRVLGNFAIPTNEMFMTLTRRYEFKTGTIGDLTTYIDPSKFNFIFAQTQLDSQNFWTQIGVNFTARRKMSAKIMPRL